MYNSDDESSGDSISVGGQSKHEGLASFISTLAIILIAPLVALLLTAFVFQSYEVDGPSMESTLQNHDRLIVLKIPRTWSKVTHHAYVPNRGDVVVFNSKGSEEFTGSSQRQLIKRVVGLPGERVVVHDGQVKIYNAAHPNGFEPDKELSYGSVIPSTSGDIDLVVPKNQVFVCGDNRSNSLDSRVFGPVAADAIVGKLVLRVYPFRNLKGF